ncbi:hypothetical protein JHS3_00920 [Jeongeupia sp. HS-3]|uniref:BON domain-containing protein n=1 Tax=Jeongeupia sp. HS-3 TaxID=1009682 RepID=UPI0018A3B80B|nr:BON domain-containing protein [Jeongeupia sp. HS-3]BCL74356.1 hypothetical protein JHS3_00920 [Jeongeupia sp. HS-3]
MKRSVLVLPLLIATLTACVPLMLALNLVEIGVLVGTDPRPLVVIKRDFDIAARLEALIDASYGDRAHVDVNAFNGVVLLSGEVPDAAAQQRLTAFASAEPGLRKLYNETVIGPPSASDQRANDAQLTARVKTAIVAYASDSLESLHLMVVTERRIVYLLGLTRPAYAEHAAIAASQVRGVAGVVVLIETGAPQ